MINLNVYLVTVYNKGTIIKVLPPYTNPEEALKGLESYLNLENDKGTLLYLGGDIDLSNIQANKDYGYWQWKTEEFNMNYPSLLH